MDLGTQTLLQMCIELDEQHTAGFLKTEPSSLSALNGGSEPANVPNRISVQSVMAVVRRHNRVCPVEAEWRRLHTLVQGAAGDAPEPITGLDFERTPALVLRLRVRDQVSCAAQAGVLSEVLRFLESLPEHAWVHMGR